MLNSFFNINNPFWRILSKFADILVLNLLFVFCSIPVITIGASYTALYFVMRKLVKNEEGSIVKTFLCAFRDNFKQATIIWLIMLLAGGFLILGLYLTAITGMILNYVLIAFSIPYLIVLSYVFPILSQFNVGTFKCIQSAFFLGIAHLPLTIVIVAVNLLPLILAFFSIRLLLLIPLLMLLFGFGLTSFCNCFLFDRIFARYIHSEAD